MRAAALLLALAAGPAECARSMGPGGSHDIMARDYAWTCLCTQYDPSSCATVGPPFAAPDVQAPDAATAAQRAAQGLRDANPGATYGCHPAACYLAGMVPPHHMPPQPPPDPGSCDAGSDAAPGCVATGGDCTGFGDAVCCSGSCGGFSCL